MIDSTAQGFTPHSFAWCGNTLLYGLFDGQIDWHALDMEFSAEEANAYVAARFRALAWDTTTREEAPGIPGGFAAAVADRRAEHVLLAGNRLLMGRDAGPRADLVQVYSWPERRITLESVCACGGALSGAIGAARWLVGGCTEPDGFFLRAERETAALPEVVGEYPVPVLAFLDLSGHLKDLSDPDQVLILSGKQHWTPIPAIVDEGSAVAVLQRVLGGKIGIAVYAADGLRREYPFSVSRPFPPKLAEVSPWWELVVCTPDGKHALFQEARDPYHWDEPRGAPWRVYLWDLEAETYEPIVEMNEIEYCFGWLPDSALLVGALAEGQSPDQHVHRLYDYGVLHLTRPPE